MNKHMIGAASGVLLRATGVAVERLHQPVVQSSTRRIISRTPQQREMIQQGYRLEDAAAAALDDAQYSQAENDARSALSLKGTARAQELLAAALDVQGKTQEAIGAYKVMADAGDVFPRNQLPYALLLLKTGQWAQAVAAYDTQLPYLAEGDLMKADSRFSPSVPQPRQLEIAIHIGLGLTEDWKGYNWKTRSREQTLAQFQQALALEPDSSLANYYYAYGLLRIGRRAEAQAAFKKAAALGNGDVKAAAEKALR